MKIPDGIRKASKSFVASMNFQTTVTWFNLINPLIKKRGDPIRLIKSKEIQRRKCKLIKKSFG